MALRTGADVAASTDETGAATLGGDWELEHEVGQIEANSLAVQEYEHLLEPPTVDLNSGFTETEIITNGSFDAGKTGWTETGSASVIDAAGRLAWTGNNTTGTLTQTGLSGWDSGNAPSGAAQLTFTATFNNDNTGNRENVRVRLNFFIGDVLYLQLVTPIDSEPNVGTLNYFNGATNVNGGSGGSFSGFSDTLIVLNLPADVAPDGDFEMRFNSSAGTGGGDNIRVDNFSALNVVDADPGSGVDFATNFEEGGAPVAIADTDASSYGGASRILQSATIRLSNASSGNELRFLSDVSTHRTDLGF